MLHTSVPPTLQATNRKHELIIADGLAPEIQILIQDAKARVISLDQAKDPLQALTTALAGETLDVLHIVAHGHMGGFEIGGHWVDQDALLRNAHLLMHWQVRRVALWVCELGLNQEFAETLARLSGAEVYVSKGRLGWDRGSGERHWSLEGLRQQGRMDGAQVFGSRATASWNHQLVTLKLQGIYATTASGASDTFYGEETNSVTINTTPLSSTNVTFSQAGIQFSGNNVLGTISYKNAGGTTITFDGLASRPIKVGGVVKGFYVWLDNDHNSNGSAADTAFILSLDNSYFNSTANIGSSSDRVDSSMNSVLPVNSAPAAVNDAVTLNEDNPASGNVLTNDTDANGDALTVTSFTIGGVAGTLGASNTIAGVGTFTLDASGAYSFTPLPNYNGSVPVIRYTTSDGNGGGSSASLTFTITPVNDAPTSTDASVTTLEDAGKILSLANFGSYSDAEGTPLAAVKITTLPALGTLTLNGTAVSSGQSINASDISAGKLVYTPAANGNGTAYTTLKFQVGDGALFSGDNTLTVNVTPVNDAPAGSDATLTINEDSTKTFAASDFGFTDPTDASANALGAVLIATLPQAGSLKLNNVAVTAGQSISAADIAAGKLTYTPASNANGTSYASFTFQVQDDGGTANGGKNLDPTPNTITLNVTAVNDAPNAVNDAAQAIWSATSSYRSNPSGNVKTNDSDPDSGDTFSVVLANAGSSFNAGTASTIGSTSISPTGERTTYTVFTVGNASASVGDAVTGTGIPAGTTVTARSSKTLTISTPAALTAGQAITVGGTGDTIATLVTSSSTVIAMDTPAGTISAGMDITGTGIPSGTKVTGVTTATGGVSLVTIDKALTATVGTDVTIGSSGATLTGTYGTLLLQSDGTYTYAVTNSGVANGNTDQFSYQVKDSSNATATATLTVTINVAAAAAPTAVADTASVTEKGGTNNGTGTGQVTGDVTPASGAGTDTTPNLAGSISVVAAAGPTDANYTTVGATDVVIHGRYGDLSIKNDGTYTYTASSSNSTVDALNSSEHLTDVFSYRITDNGGNFSTTTLTVTVNGANDAPVATDDVGWATEAGGTANGTTGQGASGNVLTNDTDVDNGSTKAVSAIRVGSTEGAGTAGSLGSGLDGSYGTLTLNANGSYTYVVNETAANSLAAGTTVTDSFNYTVSDGSLTDTAVLSITVTGANDAPVNTVPASQTLASYETKAISGLSVTDPDGNLATSSAVALSVSHGSLSATTSGAGTLSGGGTDASPLLLSGSTAEVQAMLGTVIYTPTSGYSGADALRMVSTDALGLTDTDVVGITVTADNRPLTVSGTAVNEASPFVFFTVGGAANQLVSLSVTGTSATSGTDFISNLQYFNGSSWQAYSGTPVAMSGTTLLVRLPVLQDTTHEGVESLQLTASNGAGSGTTNTSSIADDGSGAIFLEGNTTGTPDTSGVGYPASLDDDRPLTVTDLTVNEASSHAVFKITGAAAQVITLALASGSATATADYASALEVQNPGTGQWEAYGASATLAADGTLFVRVAINPDNIYEGPENFGLTATNGSGIGYIGTAIIVDDGTGLNYDGNVSGGSATATATGLDNDLSVSVSAAGPVNEGSTYAMFTVTATAGENLALSLSGSGSAPATIGGFTLQYSYNGTTWTTYSSSSQPAVPGALGSGTGVVYVRANISSEQDNTYEGTETFTLTASTSTGAGKSASAETSIVDDGSGSKYDGTLTGGVPTSSNAGLDNDVPTVSVSSVTVSEASAYAVVSVSLSHPSLSDVSFTPTSSDGSATGGTDFGTGLEYFNGTAWTPVTGSLTIAAGYTSILLRAPISHDDLYEGAETFTISTGAITGTVTNGGAASGTVTIKDDGSSTNVFLGTNQSATPTAGTADNDTPTISVSGSAVTEGDAIVFTVSLDKLSTQDISFTPVVGQIGDGATVGADTTADTTLEVSTDGGAHYNTVTGTVTIAAGESSLRLRLATVDDASTESAESLTLSTGAIAGTVKNPAGASGAGSINDNDGPGISLSKATLTTNESGTTDSFTVKLNSQPTADVTVTLTGLDATEGSLSTTTLTFTAANWNTAQTVTVTGEDDPQIDGNIAYTLTATTSSTDGNYSGKTGSVAVTNADDDSAALVLGAISAHTTEAGGTATFTVKLSSQPTGTVTVATSSSDGTEGSVAPASLSFNASNWDTPQTVTVTGVDDPLIDGAIGYTVDLSATSGDSNYDGKTGSVNVTNDDNDSAGLTLSKATLATGESGTTDSFTVKLNSQPTADVTVTLTGLDATEGSLSTTTLTFTAANWNTAQTVTVTGADDTLVDGNIAYTLTATSSSTDGNYSAKTGSVAVTNADNDSAGLTLSKATLATNESGTTDSFTVKLNSQPTANVTVTLTGLDATEGSLSTTTLTFTAANWNTEQTFTVTGADDDLVDGDIAYTLTATSSSTDGNYSGKTGSVAVTNADNDRAGLTLSKATLATGESGTTDSFTVKLNTQPTADVTVTFTGLDATEGSLSTTTLTFTAANWNTAQTVTVTGADDTLVDGNIAYTLTATSSSTDGNYSGKTGSVAVTNADNDVVSPPPPTPEPPVQPTPPFSADLDPASDTGVRDNVTMITAPDFTLNGGSYLSTGGSARLLDASGQVIGSSSVTAADVQAGTVNVTTGQLDDGQYTFQAQVLDATGQVVISAPVTVTVVTDRDGIRPSVELAANNGDYNQDGTPDWQQNNVAQLPLLSLTDFQAGINAPAATFGAIIAGTVDSIHTGNPVKLDAGAQLLDLSISAIPAPLPDNTVAGSAMFNFSVTAQTGAALTDIAPDRAGLQTQVVIDLPTGITANAYMKYNAVTGAWTNFANPAAVDGSQDGAALLDTVGDGKVHRIVITLTDGGAGDEDGTVNGVIVDPGLLAFISSPPPAAPSATPVYSVRLASGDRFYTTSVTEAATMAKGSANVFEGVRFDSLDSAQGGVHQVANHNPFTNDWYFAVDGGAMPYACYQQIKTLAGFSAAAAGKGPGEDFHLYLNGMGLTQLVTQAEAASLSLTSKGYMDRGVVFNTTTTSAFTFDAEAYLVANKNDAAIQNLVKSLSGSYTSTSDAQFIEAVEQQYLTQVSVVGTAVAHGTTATAADLNAAFGTHFLA